MIHFTCAKCGKSFTAINDYAGKKGRCINCKSEIFVPLLENAPPPELKQPKIINDVPQQVENNFYEKSRRQDEQDDSLKRKYPWLIDIFFYPFTKSGLTMILVLAAVPLALMLISYVLGIIPVFGIFISFIAGLIISIINLYVYIYLCQCIQDSAGGHVRHSVSISEQAELGEAFLMMLRLMSCLILFSLPSFVRLYYFNEADNLLDFLFYFGEYRTPDKIFYYLLGFGAALFPMGLLSVVLHESFSGLNPIRICKSILNTHVFYIFVILFFWGGIATIIFIRLFIIKICTNEILLITAIAIFRFFKIYLLMIVAHIMGRFYYKNSHRLDWL
jgi:hypothetical protein